MQFNAIVGRVLVVSGVTLGLVGCGGGGGGGASRGVIVDTLAGSATAGNTDGPGATALFNNPVNVAVDNNGNTYVADFDNNRVRMITPAKVVSTIVNQADFQRPFGLAVMPDGRLFVQTDGNDAGAVDGTTGTIWRVNVAARRATVVARNLGRPRGITAYNSTQLVLSDLTQSDVRLLNVENGTITPLAGRRGSAGFADGQGIAARFSRPYGPTVTTEGNILVADQDNNAIRLITPTGNVVTFAGGHGAGFQDGTRSQALFNRPQDVEVDRDGTIYVTDNLNHRIRRIVASGQVSTIAGDGTAGFKDGTGREAKFFGQEGMALTGDGNTLIVADGNNGTGAPFNRIRRLQLP